MPYILSVPANNGGLNLVTNHRRDGIMPVPPNAAPGLGSCPVLAEFGSVSRSMIDGQVWPSPGSRDEAA